MKMILILLLGMSVQGLPSKKEVYSESLSMLKDNLSKELGFINQDPNIKQVNIKIDIIKMICVKIVQILG